MAIAPVTRLGDVYYDDLQPGAVIVGPGLTISETHLIGWAGLTGDVVSLHLDEEFAATTGFGTRVGAGPMTMAFALGLIVQTGLFANVRAWLGADDVRALAPVLLGDTIRPRAEITEARLTSRGDTGIWTLRYTVTNQRDEDVMTFTSRKMMLRRPGSFDL